MIPDIDTVSRIIRETAEAEILPRFRRLASGDIQEKTGPGDLVTAADLAAEAELERRLGELAPAAAIVAEEQAAEDPRIVERIGQAETAWIIDPVDGTLNFAEGRPEFAVMVAFVVGGRTEAGWIHDPMGARTAVAARGEGAWSEGGRLRVAAAAELAAMTGSLYASARRTPEIHRRIKALRHRFGRLTNKRCVGHEYLALATGMSHFALFTRLMPWDHAPGVLIHGEAGGFSARLDDGAPYSPTRRGGLLLLAPDAPCWRRLADLLLGRREGAAG